MTEQVSSIPQQRLLSEATVQELQLELIRRTQFNAFHGEKIYQALLAHRELWQAVMLDRFCFSNPGKLPSAGLIKLRDLQDNLWNADTLYILTPDIASARQLAHIAEDRWGGMAQVHDDPDEVARALGSGYPEPVIVSVWWD